MNLASYSSLSAPTSGSIEMEIPYQKYGADCWGSPLQKSCVHCSDKQNPNEDFDRDNLYAHVSACETIHHFLEFVIASSLIMQEPDFDNRYLYAKLDVPIIVKQPTNSSGS